MHINLISAKRLKKVTIGKGSNWLVDKVIELDYN
jgi:hypothetical protein